jgi:hypothetical protein
LYPSQRERDGRANGIRRDRRRESRPSTPRHCGSHAAVVPADGGRHASVRNVRILNGHGSCPAPPPSPLGPTLYPNEGASNRSRFRNKVLGCRSDRQVLTGRGQMRRRKFIAGLSITAIWPLAQARIAEARAKLECLNEPNSRNSRLPTLALLRHR